MHNRLEELRNMDADKCLFLLGNIVLAVGIIVAILVHDVDISIGNGSQCVFFQCTGLFCPGCGGTRAMLQFFQGHFITSMKYNIFMTYLMAWFSIFMISHYLHYLTKGRIPGMHFKVRYVIIGAILLVAHFTIRNIMLIKYGCYLWPIG